MISGQPSATARLAAALCAISKAAFSAFYMLVFVCCCGCLLQRWKLRPDHLDEFVDLWAEYDDGTGSIEPKDLEAMLLRYSQEVKV